MPWAASFACGYLRTKNDHGQTTMPGVSHKSKHMPGKERYQSRMRLHGRHKFPERSGKENPEPAPERWREGVLAARAGAAVGDAVDFGGRTLRLSMEDSGERDALAPSGQGSAAAHAVSTATTGPLGEILTLGSLGALLPRSFDL